MEKNQRSRLELRAAVLKALAHPSRLFILEKLSEGSLCVNDLTKMIGADISTVSRHLSLMKNAGLIADEKRGKQVFYSVRMRCALNFLSCVEDVLKEQVKDRLPPSA